MMRAKPTKAAKAARRAKPKNSMDLNCQDCKTDFEFSDGEQKFYQDKGFTPPKRCKDCRQKNKDRIEREKNGEE